MFNKKHTDETRRKMSEASKRRWAEKQKKQDDIITCYRKLATAIAYQAIKDGAAWFFETEMGTGFCAFAGIDHALSARKAMLNSSRHGIA